MNTPLILASASPRRRELLSGMGVLFEVVTADIEELDGKSSPDLRPSDIAMENARLKAKAVAELRPGCWVLGADTVVALEGRLFGKPASLEQAAEFLKALSGRTHAVITGCALVGLDRKTVVFHEISWVTFQPLTDEVIARYLATVHVLDKAGAYALQEQPELIIEKVEGSWSNVIGLPIEALGRTLRKHGLMSEAP